jgi:L-ascorbate metabolism protein UlaG (beta-lactamase superfamily)
MIRVTFLAHSGFLAELDTVCLLFDWWKGELPELPDKPLFVFASHRHPDHFSPRIFQLDDGGRDVRFLLAKDIRLSGRNREKWGLTDAAAEKCVSVGGNETLPLPGLLVETLPSTDEGVAFLVTADGRTVYHAGDLNWWHWEGEDKAFNRNMEVDFKRDLEPLRGRRIDLAFAPLDPRLGESSGWGLRYLLELADVVRAFPMHQWEEFSLTRSFCDAHPKLARRIVPVERPGQSWEF